MTIVTDKDVVFLMDHLAQHSFKWEVIGTALHFLPSELENIRHSPQVITPQQRLNAVLCQWVQWPTTAHSQTPTVEILCDALRSDLVGLGAVANKLYDARNYFSSQLSLCLPDTLTAGHETRLEGEYQRVDCIELFLNCDYQRVCYIALDEKLNFLSVLKQEIWSVL